MRGGGEKGGGQAADGAAAAVTSPVVTQLLIPMVETVLQTIEILQLLYDKVIDVHVLLVVRVPQFQVVIKTVFIPQLQIVVKIDAIHESLGLGMLRHASCRAESLGDSTGAVLGARSLCPLLCNDSCVVQWC